MHNPQQLRRSIEEADKLIVALETRLAKIRNLWKELEESEARVAELEAQNDRRWDKLADPNTPVH